MAHITGFRFVASFLESRAIILLDMYIYIFNQDVFETKDEIEEVNRKLLEKLLDENEFVAVYFCKFALDCNLM